LKATLPFAAFIKIYKKKRVRLYHEVILDVLQLVSKLNFVNKAFICQDPFL
jgi:hypothetical protein